MSALLVEDDPRIRQSLALALDDEGFAVTQAGSGEQALKDLATSAPDVVLLDVMLPGMSGIEACRRIRETSDLPIIMVTARADTHDVILGLEAGADDYVTKPLVAAELAARIRALLRRSGPGDARDEPVLVHGVTIDSSRSLVSRDGEPIHLTKTELRLLCELALASGAVVSREHLLERVWGYGYFGDTRLLDVHVRRLRQKIEIDPSQPEIVLTARGQGYRVAV